MQRYLPLVDLVKSFHKSIHRRQNAFRRTWQGFLERSITALSDDEMAGELGGLRWRFTKSRHGKRGQFFMVPRSETRALAVFLKGCAVGPTQGHRERNFRLKTETSFRLTPLEIALRPQHFRLLRWCGVLNASSTCDGVEF